LMCSVKELTNDWHVNTVGHQHGQCFSTIFTSSWQLRQFSWERWIGRLEEHRQHSKSSSVV